MDTDKLKSELYAKVNSWFAEVPQRPIAEFIFDVLVEYNGRFMVTHDEQTAPASPQPVSLRQARAMPDQIEEVRQWFRELERVVDSESEDVGEWVERNYGRVRSEWERIVFGYEVLVNNACDPDLSYLDWKPEIKAALESLGRGED